MVILNHRDTSFSGIRFLNHKSTEDMEHSKYLHILCAFMVKEEMPLRLKQNLSAAKESVLLWAN